MVGRGHLPEETTIIRLNVLVGPVLVAGLVAGRKKKRLAPSPPGH